MELNAKQRTAVCHTDSPLLVIAGAGSGKTRVITQKIVWLIQEKRIPAEKITAVTFTNKAANEMKARLGQMLAEEVKVRVSTFHRLGLEIIRSGLQGLGLRPGFSIFDTKDSEKVISDVLDVVADKDTLSRLQQQISAWKNQGRNSQHPPSHADASDWEVYQKYQERMRLYNAVDFDDLLLGPLHLLQTDAALLAYWQSQIRYLLVDEYQDTNSVQYELVRLLVAQSQALTVVGDDDQSIYAWRGAQQENLLRLQQDFPNLTVVKLEQNYRSVGRILKAANQLIGNNPHLFDKSLWSALGFGEPIRVLQAKNEIHEAEKVVADLRYQQLSQSLAYEQLAILYRSNYQARLLEQALRAKEIPYTLSGGRSFFDYTEIKDVLAYLRVLANPEDDAAFLRVVNTPRRGIGKASIDAMAALAAQLQTSLFAAATQAGKAELGSRGLAAVSGFMGWLVRAQAAAEALPPSEVLKDLLEEIRYQEWLETQSETEEQARRRWENVGELLGWVANIERKRSACTLTEVVQHMSLMDMLESQQEERVHGVSLMTLHAAKGLEFDHVYLVGMEEDILPHKHTESLEEERRLAYVGVTRAKQTLTLSMAKTRRRFGETMLCAPSRFLKELPAEDLQYEESMEAATEQAQKALNQSYLKDLKARFGSNR